MNFLRKNLLSSVVVSILCFHGLSASFSVREINYNDQNEIDEVVELCLGDYCPSGPHPQKQLREKRELIKCDIREIENRKLFVCVSNKDNSICGALFCRYGYRSKCLAEYIQIKIDQKNYNFNEIMSAMTAYAEKKLAELSMNMIAVRVTSKQELEFFLQQGFCLMDFDTRDNKYTILMDKVQALVYTVLVVPMLLMMYSDYGVVCKKI
jgi:hypothetical protein